MYRCNKAFDKNVKECMWILCQNCYDIRLEELEKKEESQRKKTKQDKKKKSCPTSSRGSGRNGVIDCCPRHEVDIRSLELDENFSWVTKKHIEKLEKNYTDMDGNPGKNLIDFFIPEVCHDCEGRIPMIDGLSVKKSNQLCENELKSKNLI